MLIHELAQKSEITIQAIRFYEKKGLLKSMPRQAGSRTYGEYSEDSIQAIKHIKLLQSLGFSLNEIGEFIHDSVKNAYSPTQRKEFLKSKLIDLQTKREGINYMISNVEEAISKYY